MRVERRTGGYRERNRCTMNPIAFSTLGCPAWSLEQILDAAREYGYDALELRGLQDEMDLPLAPPFLLENRPATRQRIDEAGITVCCVSSSGVVAKNNLDHVKSHCELARDLGCPAVRVFGGNLPDGLSREEGTRHLAQTLRGFGDAAQAAGVYLVLETHDAYSTGAQVAELLSAADHPAVFSLWDLHHPHRQGEEFAETHRHLAPTLRHVHVKDGKDGTYTLMGEGDIPLLPMLDQILNNGYTGPISLEWEKRWKPDIPGPEIAFPQYAKTLHAYLKGREA